MGVFWGGMFGTWCVIYANCMRKMPYFYSASGLAAAELPAPSSPVLRCSPPSTLSLLRPGHPAPVHCPNRRAAACSQGHGSSSS